MKPRFKNTNTIDLRVVRDEIDDFAQQLSSRSGAKDLGIKTIGVAETLIPHGQSFTPKWGIYSQDADARIWQSSEPDRTFLYLRASASVTAGIEVW